MAACLEFAQQHLKDFKSMRGKILWSDEMKIELLGQNSKRYVWQTAGTAHHPADMVVAA